MIENTQLLPALQAPPAFCTTHWSVVLQAGRGEDRRGAEALEQLCRTYWYPLYAYVRRRGYTPEDAQDLTQGFFAQLLERQDLASVGPARGRFRSFLLAALNHFLANERDRARALKRAEGKTVSWEQLGAEERYAREPVETGTPDVLYERHWARILLDGAATRLRIEYVANEKGSLFDELKDFLSARSAGRREAIAARHGIGVNAVDVAIHRLRKRYGELVRAEIAQTVARPEDVEDEIRHLLAVTSARSAVTPDPP